MKRKWFSARFRFFIPIVLSVLAKECNISQLLFLFAMGVEFGKRMKMDKISTRHISLSEAETAQLVPAHSNSWLNFFSGGSGWDPQPCSHSFLYLCRYKLISTCVIWFSKVRTEYFRCRRGTHRQDGGRKGGRVVCCVEWAWSSYWARHRIANVV